MCGARSIFFQMHARDFYSSKLATFDERVLILTDLISLRDVRVKITFAIKLAEVGELAAHGAAGSHDVLHRLPIDDRQGARMRHTNRANIDVGACLIRVVLARTEHLGVRLEL